MIATNPHRRSTFLPAAVRFRGGEVGRHAFISVLRQHMRNFMPDNRCQLMLVLRGFEQACVDTYFSAGQGKSIEIVVRKDTNLPASSLTGGEGRNQLTRHAGNVTRNLRFGALGRLCLDVFAIRRLFSLFGRFYHQAIAD